MSKSIAIIGATGDVGRGIASQALGRGWDVVGIGRDAGRLATFSDSLNSAAFSTVEGSLSTAEAALALADSLDLNALSAIVVSISSPWEPRPALDVTWDDADAFFSAYLGQQIAAATAFIPRMTAGSTFVSIGGGMADFPARGMSVVSMAQAAQRMWLRHLEKEAAKAHSVVVREVMIHAMVAAEGTEMGPGGMSSSAVGDGVCGVIDDPQATDGPIVSLHPTPTR